MEELADYTSEKETMKRAFAARLRSLMTGRSVSAFAHQFGLSESLVRKYLGGRSLPGMDKLLQMARVLDVPLEWLATGQGGGGPKDVSDSEDLIFPRVAASKVGPDGELWMENPDPFNRFAFDRRWVELILGVKPQDLALFTIVGDAMEPNIWEGDIVLFDSSENGITVDTLYLLKRRGHLVLKRIQRNFAGSVQIKNDNPRYDVETIDLPVLSTIEIAGRVVWTGGRL